MGNGWVERRREHRPSFADLHRWQLIPEAKALPDPATLLHPESVHPRKPLRTPSRLRALRLRPRLSWPLDLSDFITSMFLLVFPLRGIPVGFLPHEELFWGLLGKYLRQLAQNEIKRARCSVDYLDFYGYRKVHIWRVFSVGSPLPIPACCSNEDSTAVSRPFTVSQMSYFFSSRWTPPHWHASPLQKKPERKNWR